MLYDVLIGALIGVIIILPVVKIIIDIAIKEGRKNK